MPPAASEIFIKACSPCSWNLCAYSLRNKQLLNPSNIEIIDIDRLMKFLFTIYCIQIAHPNWGIFLVLLQNKVASAPCIFDFYPMHETELEILIYHPRIDQKTLFIGNLTGTC